MHASLPSSSLIPSANGRVVLPVLSESYLAGGEIIELMSMPLFAAVAAGMGHVDAELDRDGINRTNYLKAGKNDPHWDTFALALLKTGGDEVPDPLPGLRSPPEKLTASGKWVRDYQVYIPFTGPPGSFLNIPAVDLIRGRDSG